MSSTKLFLAWSLSAAIGLAAASTAAADALLVDRGLPNANLNNAAGANRSNVTWGEYPTPDADGNTWFTGDSFSVAGAGQYRIDTIRVWVAEGSVGNSSLGDFYNNLNLYVGSQGDGVSLVQQGDLTGAGVNPNISITPVAYDTSVSGEAQYQGQSGSYYQLWRVDFNNLNLVVNGGDTIEFGVYADSDSNDPLWLHASNAGLSGTPQDGSNNLYLTFNLNDLEAGGSSYDSNRSNPKPSGGWDKSSDINVQVFGSAVPEPASLISAGVAALVLGGVGLRRRRARG